LAPHTHSFICYVNENTPSPPSPAVWQNSNR
jgi:hypothetical protein